MKIFVFGFGYAAQALAQQASGHSVWGCVRSEEKAAALRKEGYHVFALEAQDGMQQLKAALSVAHVLIVSAPPGDNGDPLLDVARDAIETSQHLKRILYWSTLGVYGNHHGRWIDEDAPLLARSPRTLRRVQAEQAWLEVGQRIGNTVMVHRLAGIYGPGRSAVDDVRDGTARRIHKDGQVFNRIHVADIAGAALAGFQHPSPPTVVNLSDNHPAPSADIVAYAAELLGAPVPPLEAYETATLSEMAKSFWQDCRRCRNERLSGALGYKLQFPDYKTGLQDCLKP